MLLGMWQTGMHSFYYASKGSTQIVHAGCSKAGANCDVWHWLTAGSALAAARSHLHRSRRLVHASSSRTGGREFSRSSPVCVHSAPLTGGWCCLCVSCLLVLYLPCCPLPLCAFRKDKGQIYTFLNAMLNQYDNEDFDLGIKQFLIEQVRPPGLQSGLRALCSGRDTLRRFVA